MAATGVGMISFFQMILMLGMGGGLGVPLGVPPLPEDPLLAKIAPESCLFYIASSGMAKPDASSANQTEQLFAEPEVQKLAAEIERLIRAGAAKAAERGGPEQIALADDLAGWIKGLLTRPVAVYVSKVVVQPGGAPPEVNAAAVVNLGDDVAKVKAALERYQAALLAGKVEDVTLGNDTFHRVKLDPKAPELVWGAKGKYLIVTVGAGEMESLLQRARGAAPQWLDDLHKKLPVERVSTVSMLNIKSLVEQFAPLGGPQAAAVIEATGAAGLGQALAVTGLDKTGYVNRSLVTINGEPAGILQLAGQQPLTAADLAVIPSDATIACAAKCDLAKAYDTILGVVEKIEPRAVAQFRAGQSQAEQMLGLKLVDDVLQPLGDSWRLYDSPSEGGMFIGVTLVVSLRDATKAAATQQKLLTFAQAALQREGPPGRGPTIEKVTCAGKDIYVLNARQPEFILAPSWCVSDKELIVSLYPQAIKAYLNRGAEFKSLATVPEVAAALEGDGALLQLTYADTRRIFNLLYPMLPIGAQALATQLQREGIDVNVGLLPSAQAISPHLRPSVATVRRTAAGVEMTSRQTIPGGTSLSSAPVLVALLLPAVQSAREAARRTSSMNNLKQIALAMHNYHDTYRRFPPAFKADKDGKPLLSWRVLILPFIEEAPLYEQFHLDEPWDSEHNKQLIEKMPRIYRSPNSTAGPGKTVYLTIRGPDTAFPGKDGIRFAQITDGTSNTIMAVEASDAKAVIWTKPDDLEYDEKNPLAGLRGMRAGGFIAAMCDGSVRFLSESIDTEVLKALFTRNDGKAATIDY